MSQNITPIKLPLPMRLGVVNCYLIETDAGHVLIDAGGSNARDQLVRELDAAGCRPGHLTLVILTHGDFDHTGNAVHLRETFGARIAMHRGDSGMLERGDMFWGRSRPNPVIRALAPLLFGFRKSLCCSPDICLDDGADLSEYGLDARVVHIPGHSSGSIGILTAAGDLFCGDLLDNTKGPTLNAIMDDLPAARASVERLRGLDIGTVYPGHGSPFPMALFMDAYELAGGE